MSGIDSCSQSGEKMRILNLTQHEGTEAQFKEGLQSRDPDYVSAIQRLLTVPSVVSREELSRRAGALGELARDMRGDLTKGSGEKVGVMVGGYLALMLPLVRRLEDCDFHVVTAFSRRVVEEKTLPDGSVCKVATFVHEGWQDV